MKNMAHGNRLWRALVAFLLAFMATAAVGQALGWKQLPAKAWDIGVGANGTAWVIGSNPVVGGFGIYRWNGSNWDTIPGGAVHIDVDPQGNAWVVNSSHAIYRYDGRQFVQVPGNASDVGIGANGAVWIIGFDGPGPDYGIYYWAGSGWTRVPGAALRIDVDPQGYPWVVNSGHQIFHWNGSSWNQIPGGAMDIGVGSEGTVYIVGTDQGVYKWTGSSWTRMEGGLVSVSVDNHGLPWGVNNAHQIYRAMGGPQLANLGATLPSVSLLGVNQYLVSSNGSFFLLQQADGNLCIYQGSAPNASGNGTPWWCHMHLGVLGAFTTVMQSDGNVCTYPGIAGRGNPTWCSGKVGGGGQYVLVMQDNGNLCAYNGTTMPAANTGVAMGKEQGALWCVYVQIEKDDKSTYRYIWNRTPASIWVTLYASEASSTPVEGKTCVEPGEVRSVPMDKDKDTTGSDADFIIQAEMTRTPHCQVGIVDCKTRMKFVWLDNFNAWFIMRANAQNCWWEQAQQQGMPDATQPFPFYAGF